MTEPHISERLRGETMPFRDLRTTRRNELLYEAASHIEKLEAALDDMAQYVSRADWHYLKDETRKALDAE